MKADGTVPNVLSIHLEADGHDPVTAGSELEADLAADSITGVTLSSNEFLPQDEENAADTAWYLDRFAQSDFATAARGEWDNCCASGDEGTILDDTGGDQDPSAHWWEFRAYDDLTGELVSDHRDRRHDRQRCRGIRARIARWRWWPTTADTTARSRLR